MFAKCRYGIGAIVVAAQLALTGPLAADPVADFYNGKQLRVIIRAATGGSYDTYSRILTKYLVKHLPGNPTPVPINMPGGGGLKALEYVAKVGPKDGTVITMVSQSFPMDQALGLNKALDTDLRTLNWIGNMSEQDQILYTSPISATRTLDDAKRRETVIGATGIGATSTQLIALYNNTLGTKFKIIYGYPGGAEIALAVERGELEGRNTTTPPPPFKMADGKTGELNFLIQTGLRKHPAYPNVPLLTDLAKNPEEREIFDLISKASSVSRPFAVAHGVPKERVEALRRAFDAALSDPDFLSEAERLGLEVGLTNGEELQSIVNDIISAPPAVLERMKPMMVVNSAEAVKGARSGGSSD
jgi:tripartite-type tricarboxylate transporter receptor subunit TctC